MSLQEEATLYIRELPGGGYVSIQEADGPDDLSPFQVALCVERRKVADRRDGHPPPVVLKTSGSDRQSVYEGLVEIANSNVAVAAALLRWQAGRQQVL